MRLLLNLIKSWKFRCLSSAHYFIVISGMGWILDFMIFSFQVLFFNVSAGYANLLSASLAALFVFSISQLLIFKVKRLSVLSLIIYMCYTEINIAIWAVCVSYLSSVIEHKFFFDLGVASMLSKIVITPFSLFCNFIVGKYISRKIA